MLNYNSTMFNEREDLVDIVMLPRIQQWPGAEITRFISDVQKQYEFASRLNISPEAKSHYRGLLTDLIKTYGH
tara:strand:- start:152 stop:370 length:219 start_codon:yes stop_codon:yes gene_type:complete